MKKTTPLKAIRQKCIDCCCGQMYEVAKCELTSCALYQYRMGHNPARSGIGNSNFVKDKENYTEQQIDEENVIESMTNDTERTTE